MLLGSLNNEKFELELPSQDLLSLPSLTQSYLSSYQLSYPQSPLCPIISSLKESKLAVISTSLSQASETETSHENSHDLGMGLLPDDYDEKSHYINSHKKVR
jgi:hypothetical protein